MSGVFDAEAVLHAIDDLYSSFVECRSRFPALPQEAAGHTEWESPGFYRSSGVCLRFGSEQPFTAEGIARHNAIGAWINKAFVISLYALLEYRHAVPYGQELPDSPKTEQEAVDILRKLRNKLVHHGWTYCGRNPDLTRVYSQLVSLLGLTVSPADQALDWPLMIDEVLTPLKDKCKAYIRAKARSPAEGVQSGAR